MIGLGAILLGACCLTPGPHPVSNYRAKLVLSEESTVLVVEFTYDDVALNQRLATGRDGRIAGADLEAAFPAYQRRLVEGTMLFDAEDESLGLVTASMRGDLVPPEGLGPDDLLRYDCSLEMRFPPLEDPAGASILIDWGCWRESISTSIVCEFEEPEGRRGRMYWQERQRYPLLPRESDELVGFGGEELYLVRPLEETLVGFSYLYVEPDHVRHELVLPLMSLGWLLGERLETSATDLLGAEGRERLGEVLKEEYEYGRFLRSDGELLPAGEVLVRWFTRDSIRRGVVTGDRPIPIATGFVGVLAVHPIDAPIDQLSFDASPWRRYVTDQVVSVISGEETTRYATSNVGARIHWQGWALEPRSATPTEVPAGGSARARWLPWIAGVGIALCLAGAAARRRRVAAALAIATGLLIAVGLYLRVDGETTTAQRREIVNALLENAYRACGRQDEHEALALLAGASEGALLEELYLELRGQIRGPWATGAGTRVTAVELDECELASVGPRAIAGRCAWTLRARIEHWGHVHERSLRVTGAVRAAADEESWRLREIRLLDKRIVEASSRPRQ